MRVGVCVVFAAAVAVSSGLSLPSLQHGNQPLIAQDSQPEVGSKYFLHKQLGWRGGVGPGSADAVSDLVGRVLGDDNKTKFKLDIAPLYDAHGQELTTDTFEIDSSKVGEPIPIRGNSGVALASGVMWYLKYNCNLSISWGYENAEGGWSCDNLRLPSPLPVLTATVRVTSPYKIRYYQNVCTVSYSMAWWTWARWEREIDWMALNGINLPLAFTGQEYVWATVLSSLGVTENELEETFGGPAFLAWARMGNIKGWGGPLYPSWREKQAALQKQILARMLSLGLVPVLGAFDGHVPEALQRVFPTANITRAAAWGNFNDTYTRDFLLSPFDPLFSHIGSLFLQAQAQIYGNVSHIYQCDTFNEMDPSSGDASYLQAYSRAVYQAMAASDPHAVWLMQGWLFHSSFWTDDHMSAYLSGVDSDHMIILDLNSEQDPLWPKFVKNNKAFVWCMLHNYGGLRDLHGDIALTASHPLQAHASASSLMLGTGLTMEAIEQNPIMYELMNEMGWRDSTFDTTAWVQNYAARRYGFTSPDVQNAWNLLIPAAYSRSFSWSGNWIGMHMPALSMSYDTSQDPTGITEAWVSFAHSVRSSPVLGGFQYDLVDVTRQVLSNFFYDVHGGLALAFASCSASASGNVSAGGDPWSACQKTVETHIQQLNQIFDDMETILSTDINYLLGYWIASARAWGDTDQEKQLYEFNARNQVTLWGPDGNIDDYAAKAWAGLVGTYYKQRWNIFFSTLRDAIAQKNPTPDWDAMNDKIIEWGRDFDRATDVFPAVPTGDTVQVAQSLVSKYATLQVGYTMQPNTTFASSTSVLKTTWTHNVGQLSVLCNLNVQCAGFTTDGHLLLSTDFSQTAANIDLYEKL